MQRIYIALALALTISCAQGAWTAGKLVKAPTVVAADTENNFTTVGSGNTLQLANTNTGELSLVRQLVNLVNATNMNALPWTVWWKKVDTKALSAGANSSLGFTFPIYGVYTNGYLVSIVFDNTSSVTTLQAYQQPLSGAGQLPKITITNSNNTAAQVSALTVVGKTVVVFYQIGATKVNFTSFTVGGSSAATEYTLTNPTNNVTQLQIVSGDALSSSQVLAYWVENGNVNKDSVVDFTKGTFSNNNTLTIPVGSTCSVYATDKKYYGEICALVNATSNVVTTYIRTSNATIGQLSTYSANTTTFNGVYPYGQYLAFFTVDTTTASNPAYNYELWNLDTFQPFMNKTTYLNVDSNSTYSQIRIPGGGIYGLLYNNAVGNGTITGINVVQVLGSSYLASVLGFVMTIVAGLFLF